MAGLRYFGKTGTLTVNSLLLNGYAWDIPDLSPLWHGRSWVGENRGVAGVDGTRAGRRRLDEFSVVLRGIIIGHATPAGVAIADAAEGMDTNQGLMRAALMDPFLVTGSATVAATLVRPDGSSDSANVQCDLRFGPITGSQSWRFSRCTFALGLVVPAGLFA